jgi:hypothetical protein
MTLYWLLRLCCVECGTFEWWIGAKFASQWLCPVVLKCFAHRGEPPRTWIITVGPLSGFEPCTSRVREVLAFFYDDGAKFYVSVPLLVEHNLSRRLLKLFAFCHVANPLYSDVQSRDSDSSYRGSNPDKGRDFSSCHSVQTGVFLWG